MWGATHGLVLDVWHGVISIHAPRVGRDQGRATIRPLMYFNPRAPCGARLRHMLREKAPRNFNPRAPCGARPPRGATSRRLADISIHAPRVGRDNGRLNPSKGMKRFQSTRPVWGATVYIFAEHYVNKISIHAPRVGRDWARHVLAGVKVISIHAPRVGRDALIPLSLCLCLISIHAPRVGRDYKTVAEFTKLQISIHAPRVGRDQNLRGQTLRCCDFNPRAPCGARPVHSAGSVRLLYFNPRAPCGARRLGSACPAMW